MKTEIDETQLENALETLPPPMSGGVDPRLRSAPWTKRGAAFRRAPWIAALTLLVTAAAALTTPPGRAWAQGVLQFFSRGDSDTLACITGGIAQAYYGGVPAEIEENIFEILDKRLSQVVRQFNQEFLGG